MKPVALFASVAVAIITLGTAGHYLFAAAKASPSNTDTVSGLNLPRTQFDTNTGNFHPGLFEYSIYDATYFAILKRDGINGIRLGFNVETALNDGKLKEMVSIVQGFRATGAAVENVLLCMWDTCVSEDCENKTVDPTSHGDGRPNKDADGSYSSFIQAWGNIRKAFESAGLFPKYEMFNEPFGFKSQDAQDYVKLMLQFVTAAGLDSKRVVLDGTGYADDVNGIAGYWPGLLAYHMYPNWVSSETATVAAFKQKTLENVGGVARRTYITEFGASLELQESYEQEFPINKAGWEGVNMLLGLEAGLKELAESGKPVAGTFFWHGFTDADSYSYVRTDPASNAFGLRKVQELQRNAVARAGASALGLGDKEAVVEVYA